MDTWDYLAKQLIWKQLGDITEKKILDFGSGKGYTADYFASRNEVIAIEPSSELVAERMKKNEYSQILGDEKYLLRLDSNYFDLVLCHNVLEYIDKREQVLNEFFRILAPGGHLSIVKHNREGRVMQMAVLLNNFEEANNLLEGKKSYAKKYGQINYFNDTDINQWCKNFKLKAKYGLRTFWDLQQNQEIQATENWQKNMLQLEQKVSQNDIFYNIAFFHHLIFSK